MNKLSNFINRFPYNYPKFGVEGLMRYIVIANVVVFVLASFSSYSAITFLAFDWASICKGELWRLVSFVAVPASMSPLFFAISTYFYYFIGTMLERDWGTGRFCLYFSSGFVLTILGGVLTGIVTGNATIFGLDYVYTAMFMAFAMLYPDNEVLVLFVLPIKMKWLAIAGGALILWDMLMALLNLDILGVLVPLMAFLNFIAFFWEQMLSALGHAKARSRHQNSAQTQQFKAAAKRQVQQQKQGYRHKCEICGRTDADHPNLQFRYCSRCSGYHCFCEEHIFNHTHHTE